FRGSSYRKPQNPQDGHYQPTDIYYSRFTISHLGLGVLPQLSCIERPPPKREVARWNRAGGTIHALVLNYAVLPASPRPPQKNINAETKRPKGTTSKALVRCSRIGSNPIALAREAIRRALPAASESESTPTPR